MRIGDFDLWQPGYGNASVSVYIAGTTTLASIFADEALTIPLANPQTLTALSENGIQYGRWQQPVYIGVDYYLEIDSSDQSGVVRIPVTTLSGEDASLANITPQDGSVAHTAAELFGRIIHAEDHGEMSPTVAATTNATLVAAIGVAAGLGGGTVLIPEGTYPFTGFTLSAGVVVQGRGRTVTTLQCQTGGDCVTIGGDRAGLRQLSLSGVALTAGSRGVFSKAKNETVFDDIEIKSFDIGLYARGGRRNRWRNLYIDGCNTNVRLHGDLDTGGGSDGDDWRDNEWIGGLISNGINVGLELKYIDKFCEHNVFRDLGFVDNLATALHIEGVRYNRWPGCWWSGNTKNIDLLDVSPADDNATVIGAHFPDCVFDTGTMEFTGTAGNVLFERSKFVGNTITLTAEIKNPVMAVDSTEDANVSLAGDTTKWCRWNHVDDNIVVGTTSDATATKAWSIPLAPGQVAYLEGIVVGNQTNGINTGEYHVAVSAERPASSLAYDTQTANFTVGQIVTGGNSGATALIVADADSGGFGTLSIRKIDGVFQDGEPLTDPLGGSALANGTQSDVNAALLGSVAAIRAVREDVAGWDATFVANGPEIELRVTGAASTSIDWTVRVRVTT